MKNKSKYWEIENNILDLCNYLNSSIRNPFHDNSNELVYNQTFTSIDVIEDSQMAINEFKHIESNERGKNILLIYGLLQSLFLQQDGLHHLYKCVVDKNIKLDNFFDAFSFDKTIREVRNDIAGHPTNRNNTEFYFIEKGTISKEKFTYAGYTPKFRKVDVDLNTFITKQSEFTINVLQKVKENILKKNQVKKDEHKNKSLKRNVDLN